MGRHANLPTIAASKGWIRIAQTAMANYPTGKLNKQTLAGLSGASPQAVARLLKGEPSQAALPVARALKIPPPAWQVESMRQVKWFDLWNVLAELDDDLFLRTMEGVREFLESADRAQKARNILEDIKARPVPGRPPKGHG